ncbi:hypothetical protein KOW79_004442 [Hemibagrus wyckioides]|uniref:Uncharacterized protein n=1 Tax=Hemibagrus wyckioides TaxID=337641 RepID=A0A9D3P456_9TELE|nr:UPF0688 protein C1orf174 homolog [Hemibagrus wyckioides]KAG7332608.1 hypothetical protein KOW79_004442 [Hemibagrus wyckioides]
MAGDSGERKRLPKRPSSGHRAEKASGSVTEMDRTQARLVSCTDRGGRKERRGKENSAGKASASARANPEKMEDAECCGSADRADPGLIFDEDSNHIFPVEQFFGNLDAVQDISRRSAGTEGMTRREYRRRHYYAKEDSDEEQT